MILHVEASRKVQTLPSIAIGQQRIAVVPESSAASMEPALDANPAWLDSLVWDPQLRAPVRLRHG